jgi:cytochrome P450
MQLASPKRHHTLLFSPTDERWKAVRKSVATAFSVANMRALYPKIRDACAKVSTSRICGVVASSQSVSGHHMQCTTCQYALCPAPGSATPAPR